MIISPGSQRSRQAHQLFSLRQEEADVRSFALVFHAAARDSGFNESELKTIFNRCLNEPLTPSEMRMLTPLGFVDQLRYTMNREESRGSTRVTQPVPLSSIPEDRAVGVLAFGDPCVPRSTPESSPPPVSLRGKRERRISWESASGGSSSESVLPATALSALSAPRPRRKKRKKGASCSPSSPGPTPTSQLTEISVSAPKPQLLVPAQSPQPTEPAPQPSAQPPLQPLPSAQPPLQPLPSAQPPLQPLPSAQPPQQPLPSAQPPLQPLPSAQPPLQPLPSAQPPLQPLPSAQPPLQPLPSAQPPLQPLPSAQPPVS
nr:uncharacterized protein LOC129427239 [Misgurnus anguillicaudatus]